MHNIFVDQGEKFFAPTHKTDRHIKNHWFRVAWIQNRCHQMVSVTSTAHGYLAAKLLRTHYTK
jgi:hypothetical protein